MYERVKQVIEPVKSQKQLLNQSATQQGNIPLTITSLDDVKSTRSSRSIGLKPLEHTTKASSTNDLALEAIEKLRL